MARNTFPLQLSMYLLIEEKLNGNGFRWFKDGLTLCTHCIMLCVYSRIKREEWRGHSACASQLWLSSFLDTSPPINVVVSFIFLLVVFFQIIIIPTK